MPDSFITQKVIYKKLRMTMSTLLLVIVVWQWGSAAWIALKAELAQWLIADAWEKQLRMNNTNTNIQPVKPWPWADTWPVARLQTTDGKTDLWVLAGADGTSLAFGPGLMAGTAAVGEGTSVIGGHRDTHFRFLKHLAADTGIRIQGQSGYWEDYRVTGTEIVNSKTTPLQIDPMSQQILLITCYPFDAIVAGGPLRYVVKIEPVETPKSIDNNSRIPPSGPGTKSSSQTWIM